MIELQSNTLKTNNSSLSCSSGPTDQGSVFTRLDRFIREVFFWGGILPSPPRTSFLKEWWNAWTCNQASDPVIATVPRRKNKNKKGICQPHGKIVSRSFSFISLQMEENKDKQFSSACAAAATNRVEGWQRFECWTTVFWKNADICSERIFFSVACSDGKESQEIRTNPLLRSRTL